MIFYNLSRKTVTDFMEESIEQVQFFYKDANAPKPNKPNHIGTSVIIEYCDKILIEHRKDSDTWAIIGGGLWIDETLYECAQGEVLEETGIQLVDEKFVFLRYMMSHQGLQVIQTEMF